MKQFRDINDILCLTDKEIKENFSDRFYVGDYALCGTNLIKIRSRGKDWIHTGDSHGFVNITHIKPITRENLLEIIKRKRNSDVYKISFVTRRLIQIFGSDNVDVSENSVIIYFPEITITNNVGMSHILRGVYLSFKINSTTKDLVQFYGFSLIRDTFTYKELFNNFSFPHCSGYNSKDICLGDSELTKEFKLTEFNSKVASIISFLSNENTSGVYEGKAIHSLTNYKINPRPLSTNSDLINFILQYIVDFNLEGSSVTDVYYSKPLQEIIDEAYEQSIIKKEYYESLFVHNLGDVSGTLQIIDKEFFHGRYNGKSMIYFKGCTRILKIIEIPEEDVLPEWLQLGIHSTLHLRVIETVDSIFNNFYQEKINAYAKQYYNF